MKDEELFYIDKCEIIIICVAIVTRKKIMISYVYIMNHFPTHPKNYNVFPLFKYIQNVIKIKS